MRAHLWIDLYSAGPDIGSAIFFCFFNINVYLQVDLYNAGPDSGSAISGTFIKNVLPQSPAGRTGELKVCCKWIVLLHLLFCCTLKLKQ
jgi:hypothetical protein